MKFNAKTYLKLLMVVGLIAVVGGTAGTFASFTAETTNANTFATGTLVLSNKVDSAAACLSTGGSNTDTNVNASCSKFFNTSLSVPGATGGGNLVLKNDGTLDPSALILTPSSCSDTDASGTTYHGTGNICSTLQITIQEYSDSGFTTASNCVYGGGTATACAFDPSKTIGGLATDGAINLNASSPLTGPLPAGQSRYFKVSILFPSSAGNNLQGRQADIGLTWHVDQ
jgi:predicted ribosomally synthesized peptide with SipW-like signal peptide